MAVKIPTNQIQNFQQIEAVVAGPDDANRLLIIDGQFDMGLSAFSQGSSFVSQKEIFTVLVGPVFAKNQFVQANATASLTKTSFSTSPGAAAGAQSNANWNIVSVDADWDDESGQVELRIEAQVSCTGVNQIATINGFAFHVTILAAVATG